ncbi:DMT family transporter [Pseudorhodoplanes sp.]|uniref:DMT family transporter n=1 Tax=Pseudorhodoplanes sp. TaxID=1934341 RepID=UPI002C78E45F|nr:DMT family transporter [Pseudorhodoplanes sp.]HWV52056.1 DMT family transporter [Pseudorhodoplanes sp.]
MTFVLLWSTGFISAKYGMPYAEPLTFLFARMGLVVLVLAAIVVVMRVRMPTPLEAWHSLVAGFLVQTLYLGGVFVALSQGVPAGISALIPGLQPILTATLAGRFLGEKVSAVQWGGFALGLVGVLLVLNDRNVAMSGSALGWVASVVSLLGITLGTLYQKRYGGAIDWRSGNLFQFGGSALMFAVACYAIETRPIDWTPQFILALGWSVIVLSVLTIALMYWLIRRIPASRVASLFYLVPAVTAVIAWLMFGETLNALAIGGMVLCAGGVFLVNYKSVRA